MWAQDHDGNASTQLLCAGFNATSISEWAVYEYDAVYALAHARSTICSRFSRRAPSSAPS